MAERNLFYEQLEKESSGDYVEVVRCKNCKYYNFDKYGLCELLSVYSMSYDFFCADGERKE